MKTNTAMGSHVSTIWGTRWWSSRYVLIMFSTSCLGLNPRESQRPLKKPKKSTKLLINERFQSILCYDIHTFILFLQKIPWQWNIRGLYFIIHSWTLVNLRNKHYFLCFLDLIQCPVLSNPISKNLLTLMTTNKFCVWRKWILSKSF